MDWRTYADATGADLEQIKDGLPLEWVISQQAGIPLEEAGEKAVGICPFHDDTDPSLDVYADGKRWGCFPCGLDGDLFDFIGRYWGLESFPAQLEQAQALLGQYEAEDGVWERVAREETPAADLGVLADEARYAWSLYENGTRYPVAQLLESKLGLVDVDPDWLHRQWRVGVDSNLNVVAPYVALDGSFVSYKTRYSGSNGWYARKGGKLSCLYGEHQLTEVDVDVPVWICEGETDTWLASWLLGERGVALGLPTGAGSTIRPEWVDLFRGRTVTLVFDADQAGRSAARGWHRQLAGVASELRVSWPDAGDLCESAHPMGVLWGGETVPPVPAVVTRSIDGTGYAALKADGDVGMQLSNWTVTPLKRIINTDLNGKVTSQGMEVHFDDARSRRVRVPDGVWDGGKEMLKWVKLNNRAWFGAGSKHTQAIFSTLVAETPFLGTERGVEVIGLHGVEEGAPVFVLEDEVIGSPIAAERWRYTPPTTGSADFSRYKLYSKEWEPSGSEAFRMWAAPTARALMGLNHRAIMTPIVAWLCAAVGRSLVREFPPLGVFGGSETGKTTVVRQAVLTLLGLDEEHNLTNTTPHGVRVWAAATNAIALWFDEYRLGARRDTMETMNQTLRDAWTASVSSRGGFGDDKQKLHESKSSAPIIVSGEEALEEKSHIDRVVAVALRKQDLDPGALRALEVARGVGGAGRLGRAYIEWFVHELSLDRVGGVPQMPDRRLQGEAVLEWGWALWRRFALEVVGLDDSSIGDLDLSSVRGERSGLAEHPLVDALEEALETGAVEPGVQGGMPVAWVLDKGSVVSGGGVKRSLVAVRVRAFQKWALNAGYQLPGSERSTRSWYANRYTVDPRDRATYGMGQRVKALLLVGVLEEMIGLDALAAGSGERTVPDIV